MKNLEKQKHLILVLMYLLCYIPILFQEEAFTNEVLGLEWKKSSGIVFIIFILKIATIASVITLLTQFLFRDKLPSLKNLIVLILLPTSILNLIFITLQIESMLGYVEFINIRSIFFIFMNCIGLYISFVFIKSKEYKFNDAKMMSNSIKSLTFIFFFSMPVISLQVLFGNQSGLIFEGFTKGHENLLITLILMPVIFYLILRKKTYETKKFVLIVMSLSSFINYFYRFDFKIDVASWPLHLCNAAIILILYSLITNSKKTFYFTYFVNVLGTWFAMALPNTGGADAFSLNAMHFWFNHIYAYIIPFLAVTLGVFERPKIKYFKYAFNLFSIYYLVVLVANPLLSNKSRINPTGKVIDYFFINSDFYVKKLVFMRRIYELEPMVINIRQIDLTFRPIYQLLVYIVFVILMLLMWVIYNELYTIFDHYEDFYDKLLHSIRLKRRKLNDEVAESSEQKSRALIKVDNVLKSYKDSNEFAVKDISFSLERGKVVGFLGHNGAGKSTMIKSITGIHTFDEGCIEVAGYNIKNNPLQAKKQIGYVPDNHAMYEYLTGREYINYVADLYKVTLETRNQLIDKFIKVFDLEHAINRQLKTYSHGMKQKIAVIATILHSPKVWILDEPLTGLDPLSVYQIKQVMKSHVDEGNLVFFSSHIIDVVEKVCDEIVIISNGEIKLHVDMDTLVKSGSNLEEIYINKILGNQ